MEGSASHLIEVVSKREKREKRRRSITLRLKMFQDMASGEKVHHLLASFVLLLSLRLRKYSIPNCEKCKCKLCTRIEM
jgi:hypothetical protein